MSKQNRPFFLSSNCFVFPLTAFQHTFKKEMCKKKNIYMEITFLCFPVKNGKNIVWKMFELLDYSLIFFQLFDNAGLCKS